MIRLFLLLTLFAVGNTFAKSGTYNETIDVYGTRACVVTWSTSRVGNSITVSATFVSDSFGTGNYVGCDVALNTTSTNQSFMLGSPTSGQASKTQVFTVPLTDVINVRMRLINGVNGGTTSSTTVAIYASGEEETLTQTVTISPTSGSVLNAASIVFTASGGHNGYQWGTTGGGLAFDGSSAIFTASSPGTFTVTVYSPAGDGYGRSNDASATITVDASFRKSVSLKANDGAHAISYLVFQNGEVVAEYTQNPGASARIVTIVVPTNAPLTVASQVVGVDQDEATGSWTIDPGAVSPPTVSPPIIPTPSEDPETPPIDAPEANAPNSAGPTGGTQTTKPIWSSFTNNTDPDNQTDLLTNTTFREGVDKIAEPLTKWEEARKQAQELTDSWFGNGTSPGVQTAWDGAQSGFTDIASRDADQLIEKAVTTAPITGFSIPSGTLSLGADIDSGLPGGSWKLEPFTFFPWLQTMLLVIREIILWGMAWMFYAAAQAKLERIQFALSLVPQVDVQNGEQVVIQGNQVPGSSTAVALTKRLLVAGAIIGTIHIQLAALITAWNSRMGEIFGTEWTFADVGNIANTVQATYGGPIGTALQIMDTVFPVTAGVAYIVTWGLFSWACVLTYAAASAAIKAIKI